MADKSREYADRLNWFDSEKERLFDKGCYERVMATSKESEKFINRLIHEGYSVDYASRSIGWVVTRK